MLDGFRSSGQSYETCLSGCAQACLAASYEHGHPTGKVAIGALAYLITRVMESEDITLAVHSTVAFLEAQDGAGETLDSLTTAIDLSRSGDVSSTA